MIHLRNENLNDLIKDGKVLVDFFATWCGPCKMLGQELEELDSSRSDFKIVKIDVDDFPDLAREYGVMSIPTLVYFNNGQMIKKEIGFVPKEVVLENINNL